MPDHQPVPGRTQRSRHQINAILNAASTKGARMKEGKSFTCHRKHRLVTGDECRELYSGGDDVCTGQPGPCAVGNCACRTSS